MSRSRKVCSCCGGEAGRWEQWYNRDTGYGMCAKCIDFVRERGESEDEIRNLYGVHGIHWGGNAPPNPFMSHEADPHPDGLTHLTESEIKHARAGLRYYQREVGIDPEVQA